MRSQAAVKGGVRRKHLDGNREVNAMMTQLLFSPRKEDASQIKGTALREAGALIGMSVNGHAGSLVSLRQCR